MLFRLLEHMNFRASSLLPRSGVRLAGNGGPPPCTPLLVPSQALCLVCIRREHSRIAWRPSNQKSQPFQQRRLSRAVLGSASMLLKRRARHSGDHQRHRHGRCAQQPSSHQPLRLRRRLSQGRGHDHRQRIERGALGRQFDVALQLETLHLQRGQRLVLRRFRLLRNWRRRFGQVHSGCESRGQPSADDHADAALGGESAENGANGTGASRSRSMARSAASILSTPMPATA